MINYFLKLLIITSFIYARNASISGLVIDSKNQKPLIGANVFITETSIGTSTNDSWHCFLSRYSHYQLGTTLGVYFMMMLCNMHLLFMVFILLPFSIFSHMGRPQVVQCSLGFDVHVPGSLIQYYNHAFLIL